MNLLNFCYKGFDPAHVYPTGHVWLYSRSIAIVYDGPRQFALGCLGQLALEAFYQGAWGLVTPYGVGDLGQQWLMIR